MPRAIWRGAISFGMVSIPVKLFTATDSKDIAFRQLAGEDLGRVKMMRWSPTLDREVAYDELVKGYEYAKDQYVIVDQEDFDTLPVPSKHTIQITAFVKADEIDPVYYERTYGLEPEEAGLKPFKLLLQAMEEKHLIAIGKLAIRQKEHLCALRPHEDGIVIETLYYPDEIRDLETVDLSEVEVSEEEMKMAYALIDMLEKPFDPGEYHDEYRDALMELIQAKLEGGEIVRRPRRPRRPRRRRSLRRGARRRPRPRRSRLGQPHPRCPRARSATPGALSRALQSRALTRATRWRRSRISPSTTSGVTSRRRRSRRPRTNSSAASRGR
jgi:DNA end-binding protein Ku